MVSGLRGSASARQPSGYRNNGRPNLNVIAAKAGTILNGLGFPTPACAPVDAQE